MKKLQKGFTLIELLVVVAIIGILATVVLASLGQARSRAKDAAIKSALSGLRADMELHNIDASTYVGGCASLTTFTASVNDQGGTLRCGETATTYAATSKLVSTSSKYFCVDSTGFSGERNGTAPTTNITVCPAS